MATKKATSKKPATKSTKKPAAKRTTAKKPTSLQSFRVAKDPTPFMTFKITQQTLYWLIIAVISIAFSAWVLKVQGDINELYNQIEVLQASEIDLPIEPTEVNVESAE